VTGVVAGLASDAQQERRTRTGLRLFRALLAANEQLATRLLPDGRLPIALFYTDDEQQAEEQLREASTT
jgi:hypothetical protein